MNEIKEYCMKKFSPDGEFFVKKICNKSNCTYVSKEDFETYQSENDVRIIGNINYYGRCNKMPKYSKKTKTGRVVKLPLNEEYLSKHPRKKDDPFCYYKIYSSDNKNTFGYASIGENKFVRIVKPKFWIFLIPLLIILVLALIIGLHQTVEENQPKFEIAQQEIETTAEKEVTTSINAIYNAYPPTLTLTKKKPYIYLYNDIENQGTYNFVYFVYVDGKCVYTTDDPNTKEIELISAGKYQAYDMWSNYEKGKYEVIVKSVPYTAKDNIKRPNSPDLKTTVIIKK